MTQRCVEAHRGTSGAGLGPFSTVHGVVFEILFPGTPALLKRRQPTARLVGASHQVSDGCGDRALFSQPRVVAHDIASDAQCASGLKLHIDRLRCTASLRRCNEKATLRIRALRPALATSREVYSESFCDQRTMMLQIPAMELGSVKNTK
jgi:hypothetical protein